MIHSSECAESNSLASRRRQLPGDAEGVVGVPMRVVLAVFALIAVTALANVCFAADSPAASAHTDAAHADGHGAYAIWSDLPFWSFIAFLGFVWLIKKLGLWDLLVNNMTDRERAEGEAIQMAESELDSANILLREARGRMEALDETVRGILAEADRDAKYTREEIISAAEREANGSVARVRHEIERVRNQSLNQLFESLADKVTAATEDRLRSGLQGGDQSRLIDQTLNELVVR